MKIENTSCYSFFLITSAGNLDYDNGFNPEENSAFDPDEITKILGIKPFEVMRFGAVKPNGKGTYNFSSWYGCKQIEPETNRFEQCYHIVQELKPHISELKRIKKKYNVNFSIEIFPCSKDEESGNVIGFSHEIIEFCYLTGTEIVVDMFLYQSLSF